MHELGKREFLQHASQFLKEVEETGEPLLITHHDQPRLKIIPVKQKTIHDLKGSLKRCEAKRDINQPVLEGFEW